MTATPPPDDKTDLRNTETNAAVEAGAESPAPDPREEQYLALKLEFEQLHSKVERLRNLLQTLVSGLAIAVAIGLVVSGWFAYRLLVQEQVARRDARAAADAEAEMRVQVEQLEAQLQRQARQLERVNSDLPEELDALNETVAANQRQVRLLRTRLQQLDPDADPSGE